MPPLLLTVANVKGEGKYTHNGNHENMGPASISPSSRLSTQLTYQYVPHRYPHSSLILRGLLLPDKVATRHSSQPVTSRYCSRGGGALPLPHYIVRHKRVQCRPIGDVCPSGQECPDIPHSNLSGGREAEHQEARYETEGVERDQWPA